MIGEQKGKLQGKSWVEDDKVVTYKMMNSNRLGSYTHIRCVCEKCAVGVNLVQKQITAGTPVR